MGVCAEETNSPLQQLRLSLTTCSSSPRRTIWNSLVLVGISTDSVIMLDLSKQPNCRIFFFFQILVFLQESTIIPCGITPLKCICTYIQPYIYPYMHVYVYMDGWIYVWIYAYIHSKALKCIMFSMAFSNVLNVITSPLFFSHAVSLFFLCPGKSPPPPVPFHPLCSTYVLLSPSLQLLSLPSACSLFLSGFFQYLRLCAHI